MANPTQQASDSDAKLADISFEPVPLEDVEADVVSPAPSSPKNVPSVEIHPAPPNEPDEDSNQIPNEVKNQIDWTDKADGDVPDWKPYSLRPRAVLSFMVAIITIMVVATILYVLSRHDTIASRDGSHDWVFQFGPTFVAIVVSQVIARMASDLTLVFPYMAMSSSLDSSIRARSLAKLGGQSFWTTYSTPLLILGFFSSAILVTFQASVFQLSDPAWKDVAIPIRTLNTTVFHGLISSSMIPSIMIQPLWNSLGMSEFRWTLGTKGRGALPFQPMNGAAGSVTYVTPTVGTFPLCAPLEKKRLRVRPAKERTWDILLDLEDEDGCKFQKTIHDSPLLGPVDHHLGAVGNNTFALWEMARQQDVEMPEDGDCSLNEQFVVKGQFDPSFLEGVDGTIDVPLTNTSGWAFLSCRPLYKYVNESMNVDFSQNMLQPSEFDLLEGVSLEHFWKPENSDGLEWNDDFDDFMYSNFFDNKLIYDLSDPTIGVNFWGELSLHRNSQLAPLQPLVDAYHLNVDDCTEALAAPNSSTTEICTDALELYIILLWQPLFAYSLSLAGLFAAPSDWTKDEGSLSVRVPSGWVLPGSMYGLTIGLYSVVIVLLLADNKLPFAHWLRFTRSGLPRTGLSSSPGSIVSRAFLFRDWTARMSFAGWDTKARKEFDKLCEEQLPATQSDMRLRSLRPADSKSATTHPGVMSVSHEINRSGHERKSSFPEGTGQFDFLWKNTLPLIAHPIIWASVFAASLALVLVSCLIILPQNSIGFQLWSQAPSKIDAWDDFFMPSWAQTFLYGLIPTAVLTLFSSWWGTVDTYFRQTQPIVGLHKKSAGSESVDLNYEPDVDIYITFKAWSKKHWKLGCVTLVTIAMKFAVVLAGGVFVKGSGPARSSRSFPLLNDWTAANFQIPSASLGTEAFRNMAIARAPSGFTNTSRWEDARHVYTPVDLGDDLGGYELILEGVTANLSCVEAKTSLEHNQDAKTGWAATLTSASCKGETWLDGCAYYEDKKMFEAVQIMQDGLGRPFSAHCAGWEYLTDCSGDSEEAWWILDVTERSGQPDPEVISLICTPEYFIDRVNVRAVRDSDSFGSSGPSKLHSQGIVSSQKLDRRRWTLQGNNSMDLPTYFSTSLRKAGLTTRIHNATFLGLSDVMSLLSTAYSANSHRSSPAALADFSSRTFTHLFTQWASQPLSNNSAATALTSALPDGARSVDAKEIILVVHADKTALLVATTILGVYCLACIALYPGRTRRAIADASNTAGVVTMIYDSSLVTRSFDANGRPDFAAVRKQRWAYGLFKGLSGEARIGIEVADEVVEVVPPAPWWRRWLRKVVGRGTGSKTEKEGLMKDGKGG